MKKYIYIIGCILLIIDQLVKGLVTSFIHYQEIIDIIPNFFYITYVKNTGGAWSIFSDNMIILLIIGIVCALGLIYFINKKNYFTKLEVTYLSFITGGLFGNLIDRIIKGGVIDFIGLVFGNYYFPVFNIADICIVCGAILLIIDSIKGDEDGNRSN